MHQGGGLWVQPLSPLKSLVKNLKAVLRCLPIRLLEGIPRGLLGIPPILLSPCPLVCGSVLRLFARPLVPGLVPATRGPPPLVRPALIGLVVPASHLALLGLVHRPSPSRTTTVRLFTFLSCLLFMICMVFYSCFTLLMALTVISVNANGLRNEHRRLGFLQWLSHLSPSVLCLQDTYVQKCTR